MKILLAFSNNLISQGISVILADEENIYTHISPLDCLEKFLNEESPEILVVDYFVLDNFLKEIPRCTRVLLLDTGCSEQQINNALIVSKISGIIEMDTDRSMLLKALDRVGKGHLWINKRAVKLLVQRLSQLTRLWSLTSAELNVLHMLGLGMDTVQIAESLGKREQNVRLYIDGLYKKINTTDRNDLIDLSRQFRAIDILEN